MDSEPIYPADIWSSCSHRLAQSDLEAIACSTVPIPYNEAERLFAVRETRLIDSDPSDPMFDRFVYLAQRLFNVPIAVVGLMDVDRQYNKSAVGTNQGEHNIPRNYTFCAYTILPNASDVLVVEDASKDIRFMENPSVTGPPYLRFYAGAALSIDNVKIGTICIFDVVPHHDFSEKDKMNMLDLAEAVSTLIRERKRAALSSDKICAAMVTDMMHNVRTPLAAIDLATSMMLEGPKFERLKYEEKLAKYIVCKMCEEKNYDESIETKVEKMTQYCKSAFEMITESNNPPNNSIIVRDLQAAVGQLKVVVESSLCLGQLIVEKAEKNYLGASFALCNIMSIINSTRQTLVHMEYSSNICWNMNEIDVGIGKRHICSPKAINFLLLNTVEQLLARWKDITINISFQNADGEHEFESVHKVLEGIARSPGGSWKHGILCINISLSCKMLDPIENSFMPNNHLGFYSRDQVLKDCEGSTIRSTDDVLETENLKFLIPCAFFEIDEIKNNIPLLSNLRVPMSDNNNYNNNNVKINNNNNNNNDNNGIINNYDNDYNGNKNINGINFNMNYQTLQPLSCSEMIEDIDYSETDSPPLEKMSRYGSLMSIDINMTEPSLPLSRKPSLIPLSPSLIPNPQTLMSLSPISLISKSPRNLIETPLSPIQVTKKEIFSNNDIKDINNNKLPDISISLPAKASTPLVLNIPTNFVNFIPSDEKKLRVLLVEDSLSIQKLMTRWLKSRGCDVTIASNGKIGLNYMLTQEYDVCFMDFLMPVMSGPEAISSFYNWSNEVVGGVVNSDFLEVIEVYNRSINKEMLLVGMSANAGDADIDVAFQHGMHFYCPKPAETTMLTAILAMRNANSFEDTLSMIGLHARGGSDKCASPINNRGTTGTGAVVSTVAGVGLVAMEKEKDKSNHEHTVKEKDVYKEKYSMEKTSHHSPSFPSLSGKKGSESTYSMDGWKLFKRITESSSRSRIPPIDLSTRSITELIDT